MQKEKRSKKRRTVAGPLHFCCGEAGAKPSGADHLPDTGIIVNKSEDGVGFLSTCPLEAGQALVINCPWLSEKTESGTVRWCRKAAIDLWKVGFQKSH